MIDLHAHILPGLDDGPADVGAAVELARAACAEGITTIVATPHVDRRWNVPTDAIARAAEVLRAELAEAGVQLDVLHGAEIALDRLASLSDAELASIALGDSRTLLVECPLRATDPAVAAPIFRLLAAGWGVVLAHPERSIVFREHPWLVADLVAAGAHVQVTAAAIAGDFGPEPERAALELLARGLANVVATDAHDLHRRMPTNARALDAHPDLEPRWQALTRDTPAAILAELAAANDPS